jgi:hypothetical protein
MSARCEDIGGFLFHGVVIQASGLPFQIYGPAPYKHTTRMLLEYRHFEVNLTLTIY